MAVADWLSLPMGTGAELPLTEWDRPKDWLRLTCYHGRGTLPSLNLECRSFILRRLVHLRRPEKATVVPADGRR